MDKKDAPSKNVALLNRWWWPGQWVRIAWVVWVDQLWYWQNVRPQLQEKRGVSFFFQALLGGSFLGLVPAMIAGLMLEFTDTPMDWKLWILGFLIGVLAAAMWGGASALFNGANWSVPACAIFGALYPFNASIIIGTITHFPYPLIIFLLYGAIGGLLLGVSENIFRVIKQGKILGTPMIIEHTGFYCIAAGIIAENVIAGVTMGLTYLFGTQIGRIWATRQVSDEEARQKLINANQ